MSKKQSEKLKQVVDMMETGIKEVFESERFKDFLMCMSKFHKYSYGNVMLIKAQKPDATHVAGYRSWQKKFNRQVNKGEKGIYILAPTPYKTTIKAKKVDSKTQQQAIDKNGQPVTEEREITKLYFRPVTVFDISQTSGEP